MNLSHVLFTSLLVAPLAIAQNDRPAAPEAPAMPNPKTAEHAPLAMLAGDWLTVCKTEAMPGVPGMEKATENPGTEHIELLCNGLWARSTITGTFDGKPFQGVWLVGYDPQKKNYPSIWVSSQEEPPSSAEGTYDAKTRTWTFTGNSSMGKSRSTMVFADADHATETCVLIDAAGKEMPCMTITRTRAKAGAAREASAHATATVAPEYAPLAAGIGAWTADVVMTMGGQPMMKSQATEVVTPICEGRWFWSDFRSEMMGQPFEGHGLTGYDPVSKTYVAYWIDSMSPFLMTTNGVYDAKTKAFTMHGACILEDGKPGKVKEVQTAQGDDARELQMTFTGAAGESVMTITYHRKKG